MYIAYFLFVIFHQSGDRIASETLEIRPRMLAITWSDTEAAPAAQKAVNIGDRDGGPCWSKKLAETRKGEFKGTVNRPENEG